MHLKIVNNTTRVGFYLVKGDKERLICHVLQTKSTDYNVLLLQEALMAHLKCPVIVREEDEVRKEKLDYQIRKELNLR